MNKLDRTTNISFHNITIPKFINPNQIKLKNNVDLFLIQGGGQQLCRVEMVFKAGSKHQIKMLQASMCNAMLFEGTPTETGDHINQILDYYGAYTQLDVTPDRSSVSLFCVNKYFDKVFPVFVNAIRNASFPAQQFDLFVEQKKQTFEINSEKVEFVARNLFFSELFKKHPYGASVELSDFDNITRQDLIDFHDNFYKTSDLIVYVSGELPLNFNQIIEDTIEDWPQKRISPRQDIKFATKGFKIHKAKPLALQSAIRIGRVSFNTNHTDFNELKFLSILLGGYFGSRLMSNIREDKGLTYSIGSFCSSQEDSGYFCIATEVKGNSVHIVLKEIYKELKRLREEKISDDEISLVKNYVLGHILKSADGPFAQASLLKNMHIQGTDFSYFSDHRQFLDQLNSNRLKLLANTYLKDEDLCEIIVGDISSL